MTGSFHVQSDVVIASKVDPSSNMFGRRRIHDVDWKSCTSAWILGLRNLSKLMIVSMSLMVLIQGVLTA